MRNAIDASFVALFLILALPVMRLGRSSVGFPVFIATSRPECGDGQPIIVDVLDVRRIEINWEPSLQTHELERRLHDIFRTRAEAVVPIKGSTGLPFGRIAEVIDIASRQADHVAILHQRLKNARSV